jgi:hypothetical protein
MNSPPVLQSKAAPRTRKSGEAFDATPLRCDLSAKFISEKPSYSLSPEGAKYNSQERWPLEHAKKIIKAL